MVYFLYGVITPLVITGALKEREARKERRYYEIEIDTLNTFIEAYKEGAEIQRARVEQLERILRHRRKQGA